jgi:hypothetical protein
VNPAGDFPWTFIHKENNDGYQELLVVAIGMQSPKAAGI